MSFTTFLQHCCKIVTFFTFYFYFLTNVLNSNSDIAGTRSTVRCPKATTSTTTAAYTDKTHKLLLMLELCNKHEIILQHVITFYKSCLEIQIHNIIQSANNLITITHCHNTLKLLRK